MPSTLELVKQLVPNSPKKDSWKRFFSSFGLQLVPAILFAILCLTTILLKRGPLKHYFALAALAAYFLLLLGSVIQVLLLLARDIRKYLFTPERSSASQLDEEIQIEQNLLFRLKELDIYEIRKRQKRLNCHIKQTKSMLAAISPVLLISTIVPVVRGLHGIQDLFIKTANGNLSQWITLCLLAFCVGLLLGSMSLLRTTYMLSRLSYVLKQVEDEGMRLTKFSA